MQRILGSTTTVFLTIGIVHVIANCRGTIIADWDNATQTLSFDDTLIGPPVSTCIFSGSIHLPGLQLT